MLDYLVGRGISSNPYHVSVVRKHLTRSHYYPDITDELFTAFNEVLDVKDNGVFIVTLFFPLYTNTLDRMDEYSCHSKYARDHLQGEQSRFRWYTTL